jgi:hypothetical protein
MNTKRKFGIRFSQFFLYKFTKNVKESRGFHTKYPDLNYEKALTSAYPKLTLINIFLGEPNIGVCRDNILVCSDL